MKYDVDLKFIAYCNTVEDANSKEDAIRQALEQVLEPAATGSIDASDLANAVLSCFSNYSIAEEELDEF